MRTVLLAAALAASAAAQPAEHVVPFGSRGNAVELELAAPAGAAAPALTVAVAEAPPWLVFEAPEVGPPAGPVARLVFDVARDAAVGVPAEVVFEVRAERAVLARHRVRLRVGAPPVALEPPRPNPSRGRVAVPFTTAGGPVRLSVVDVLGREVAVLAEGPLAAGAHEAEVEAGSLAAGVYLVRLVAGPEVRARALTVVR